MRFIVDLWLDKQAEEALALYQKAFHCQVKTWMRYQDAVSLGWEKPDDEKTQLIYHSQVFFGDQEVRLGDLGGEDRIRKTRENRFMIAFDTEDEVVHAFHALSDGGTVIRPLEKPPFLVIIGTVRDRFGVTWELLCDY